MRGLCHGMYNLIYVSSYKKGIIQPWCIYAYILSTYFVTPQNHKFHNSYRGACIVREHHRPAIVDFKYIHTALE